MLTPKQFNQVKKLVAAYTKTLNLDEVRDEFLKKGIMNQNAKLVKGSNYNVGLEILPSVLAPGLNACPGAGECKYSCLVFAGVGNMLHGKKMVNDAILTPVLKSRARKTFLLQNDRDFTEKLLTLEINKHSEIAALGGATFGARLNVLSDLDWRQFTNNMSHINFYDYTKVWSRESTDNYKLTFSASELTSDEDIIKKLSAGENVAVVFQGKLPETYLGFPVLDGDISDDRYNDEAGTVIGLKVKATIDGNKKSSFIRSVT